MAGTLKKLVLDNIVTLTILTLIVLFGNFLRSYQYGQVPHPGETTDEYNFAWAGLSLIQTGVPEGWSYVKNSYPLITPQKINVDSLFDKEPARPLFTMVKPWFDKPPVFPLLIGGYSYLKGVKTFEQAGTGTIRRPMLKIAVVTTIMLFLLANRLYGPRVGLLSSFLYSVIPTTVISSRLVIAENAYIPIFLGALLTIDYYLEGHQKKYLIITAILCSLAVLFKISGASVGLTILLILLFYDKGKEKFRDILIIILSVVSGFLIFAIYGALLDWQTFLKVFLSQSQLFFGAGAEIFFTTIVQSKITATKFFTDGWVTLGWISAFIISAIEWKKNKGGTFLTLALLAYLFTFLLFGSEGYGWYRFPFYPFLAISISRLFQIVLNKPNLFVFIGLFLLPFGTIVHRLIGVEGFQNYVMLLRILLVSIFGIFGLSLLNARFSGKLQKIIFIGLSLLLVALSAVEILSLNYDNWFFVT